MKTFIVVGLSVLLGGEVCRGALVNAWINEFHYDNNGADVGEFVEIAVPVGFADWGNITLTLYNGTGGGVYGTHLLSTFTAGDTVGGYTFYYRNIAGIQNGNPDGFALSHETTLLQSFSYDGNFTGTAGIASGVNFVDIGVGETDPGTLAGSSLGLTGSASSYSGFTWVSFSDDTPGKLNADQTINAVVPEPSTWVAGALLALPFGVHGVRYLRNRKRA